jgi:hypothetical protein
MFSFSFSSFSRLVLVKRILKLTMLVSKRHQEEEEEEKVLFHSDMQGPSWSILFLVIPFSIIIFYQ